MELNILGTYICWAIPMNGMKGDDKRRNFYDGLAKEVQKDQGEIVAIDDGFKLLEPAITSGVVTELTYWE